MSSKKSKKSKSKPDKKAVEEVVNPNIRSICINIRSKKSIGEADMMIRHLEFQEYEGLEIQDNRVELLCDGVSECKFDLNVDVTKEWCMSIQQNPCKITATEGVSSGDGKSKKKKSSKKSKGSSSTDKSM